MNLPIPARKKKLADESRCVQHYYRPARGKCALCGSPLCEECMGTGSVAVCRRCVDNPLSEEERAEAESTGKFTRKARKAKKPPPKKDGKPQTEAPAAKKAASSPIKALRGKVRLGSSQKQILKYVAAVLLLAVAAGLIVMTALHKNPFGVVRTSLDPPAQQKQLKGFVQFAVSRIEFYKEKNGKLPATLRDAGITDSTIYQYQVLSPEQYVVDATFNGQTFTYNSNQSAKEVFGRP